MATKATPKAADPIEEVTPVEEPKGEQYVTIRIPRDRDDKEDKVVWVNERRFIIKRGVPVDVPESVAAILEQEEKMLEYIYEYESKVQK